MQSNGALLWFTGIAVVGLVFLIVRLKVSAFIALILASVFVGLTAGMEPLKLMKAFQDGVGGVLGSIAMIIALGTILGKILGETGAAEVVSSRLVSIFGSQRLPIAFFFIGLVVGLPVFFAVGIVLLAPVLYATSRRHGIPMLRLGLPMVAGLSAAHGFIPPHPGPLAAIEMLKADVGKTILYSLPVAVVAGFVAGPLLAKILPTCLFRAEPPVEATGKDGSERSFPLPGFGITLAVILLPLILMTGSTFWDAIPSKSGWDRETMRLIGHPICALLIGVLVAYVTLGRGARFSKEQLLKFSEESLGPIASILLVVGAGAGFSRVLIESGVGKAVAEIATRWNLPIIPMGFVLASLIRVATGSSTVAITTTAGLMLPITQAQPGTNLELLVLSMGAGSLILSHVNDGGFWLVKGYLNMSVPQALRTWTILETVLALVGFGCVWVLDLIF